MNFKQRSVAILIGCLLLWPVSGFSRDPADPGKGFDYIFYGYSPPLPGPVVEGSSQNRAMLLLDIDGVDKDGKQLTKRFVQAPPKFKLMSESSVGSGVLETFTLALKLQPYPNFYRLIMDQDFPARFVFGYRGDPIPASDPASNEVITVQSDSALEANGQHYLRSVVDLIHKNKRTRYLVNCPHPGCDVPELPYR